MATVVYSMDRYYYAREVYPLRKIDQLDREQSARVLRESGFYGVYSRGIPDGYNLYQIIRDTDGWTTQHSYVGFVEGRDYAAVVAFCTQILGREPASVYTF